VVTVTKQAEQSKSVALVEVNKRLQVTTLELEAAQETAAALLSRGQAEAEVALLGYEAEAKPLADAISAFGGGDTYAQYLFYQKLGPALKSVLANPDGPFADIFRSLSQTQRIDDQAVRRAPQTGSAARKQAPVETPTKGGRP
jgi:hypothetical protein